MEYVVATVISVGLIAFADKPKKRNKKKWRIFSCFFAMIPLFLLSALRWDVGTDTWHTYTPEYLAMMSESRELTETERIIMLEDFRRNSINHPETIITEENALLTFSETYKHTAPGFQALERLLIAMNADVQWLYVVTSLISLTFVFAAIALQSENPVLSCLFFVITSTYFLSLNIVSQFMAISICLFACLFAERRQPVPFFLFVLLAAAFHVTAMVFLPVYFLPRLKVRPLAFAVVVLLTFFLAPLLVPLMEKLVRIVVPKYAYYLGTYLEFEIIFFALGIAVFALGTYYWKVGSSKPYYRLWYYCNVLGMLSLCFSPYLPSMKRINYYFAAPHFLFLPLVVSCEEDFRRRRILEIVLVLLFIAETFVAVWMLNKNEVLPYRMSFGAEYVSIP